MIAPHASRVQGIVVNFFQPGDAFGPGNLSE